VEIPRMRLEAMARPRPYPYDTAANLALTDGAGGADTFPAAYTALIPAGTYDFGDVPNRISIEAINVAVMPVGIYVMEFYKSYDAITYIPIGAIRLENTVALTLVHEVHFPCRPLNIDSGTLYGRLKSSAGAGALTIQFSLSVARWRPSTVEIPLSTGVWPWG